MDKKTLIALVLPSLLGASQMQAERTTNTPPQKDATTQTFKDLWKNVEQHRKQDLPQSALKVVNAIRQKAQKTNNTSHLIAAMLSTYQLEEEISSDSTQRVIEEMEQFCAADTHTVSRALWHFVLAQVLYQEYFPDNVFDDESIDIEDEIQDESAENIGEESEKTQRQLARSLKYFRVAFEHLPELATAKVEDYDALFDASPKAAASIDHNLLVVLLQHLFTIEDSYSKRPFSVAEFIALLEKSRDLFLQNHQERAALQAEILLLQAKGGSYLESLTETLSLENDENESEELQFTFPSAQVTLEAMEKVLTRYGHLPEAGEVAALQCHLLVSDKEHHEMQLPKAIALAQEYAKKYADYTHEFKNFIKEHTYPTFEVDWTDNKLEKVDHALYPETEMVLSVKFRNVQNASLRLYRLNNISATELEKVRKEDKAQENLQKILKKHGEKKPVFTKFFSPAVAPEYEERKDTISFQTPQSGLYLMRLSIDGWYDT